MEFNDAQLEKADYLRPYVHRVALTSLPAMAIANYFAPRRSKLRPLLIGGAGLAGAGLGIADRKIEEMVEKNPERAKKLTHYSKPETLTLKLERDPPMHKKANGLFEKNAGVAERVLRNRDELAEAFPITARANGLKEALQKEALALTGAQVQQGAGMARNAGQALLRNRLLAPSALGAAGALGGALMSDDHPVAGTLAGAGIGAALGHYGAPHLGKYLDTAGQNVQKNVSKATWGLFKNKPGSFSLSDIPSLMQKKPGLLQRALRLVKKGSANLPHEEKGEVRGRPFLGMLSEGAEKSHAVDINGLVGELTNHSHVMRSATESQLRTLFPNSASESYGRNRAIGRTLEDTLSEIGRATSR